MINEVFFFSFFPSKSLPGCLCIILCVRVSSREYSPNSPNKTTKTLYATAIARIAPWLIYVYIYIHTIPESELNHGDEIRLCTSGTTRSPQEVTQEAEPDNTCGIHDHSRHRTATDHRCQRCRKWSNICIRYIATCTCEQKRSCLQWIANTLDALQQERQKNTVMEHAFFSGRWNEDVKSVVGMRVERCQDSYLVPKNSELQAIYICLFFPQIILTFFLCFFLRSIESFFLLCLTKILIPHTSTIF